MTLIKIVADMYVCLSPYVVSHYSDKASAWNVESNGMSIQMSALSVEQYLPYV